MSDLKIDPATGDLAMENGDLVMLTPRDAVVQSLRQRLQFFRGEWFLDSSKGVPYLQDIFIKGASFEVIDSIFKKTILETAGIEELQEFTFDYEATTRSLSLTFKALQTNGEVIEFNEAVTL